MQNIYEDVYGLTGIIGSGKSTAAKFFRQLGAGVIDADQLAREVLTPEYPESDRLHREIMSTFDQYEQNLYQEGRLDRKVLGAIVFADSDRLVQLNAIIHPHVKKLFEKYRDSFDRGTPAAVHGSGAPRTSMFWAPIIYDVPLLFENQMEKQLKKTIVVYCPEKLAVARAAKRSGVDEQEITNRMATQISIEEKREKADYVIDNSTSLSNFEEQVSTIWSKIKAGEF